VEHPDLGSRRLELTKRGFPLEMSDPNKTG